jgi:hypothetical protein
MPHVSPSARTPRSSSSSSSSSSSRRRVTFDETVAPTSHGVLLRRVVPALVLALGVVAFQAARRDRAVDAGPLQLSAAEQSTRALLSEKTAVHLRLLRPR